MSKPDDYSPDSDNELMHRIKVEDDTVAFACLVRRYQCRIIEFVARLFDGNLDTGADIAQETFVRLWTHRARYAPNGKLVAYLLRIAYNLSISRMRSPEAKFGDLTDSESIPDPASGVDASVAVRTALQKLPEEQRVVFLLHEYIGLSYAEIAATLLIAPGTVASRKYTAVQSLRKSLDSWFG